MPVEPAATTPRVRVAVLAYGDEPDLAACVASVLASDGVDASCVIVDNGCTNPDLADLAATPGVELRKPPTNTGFAGGCNLALEDADTEFVALLNSDAVARPDCLRLLCGVAGAADVGIASASLRLMDEPELLNSRGNPLHYTGLVWAGGLGQPAAPVSEPPSEVACATGAAAVLRTAVWRDLGGFSEEYFAYQEDVDLSIRCWLRGLRVLHVPAAVALHRYEFSRNNLKMYLLERNRLVTVLTDYPGGLLRRVLPALIVMEAAVLAGSVLGGWPGQKLRGYAWLVKRRRWLRTRRRRVQEGVGRADQDRLVRHLAARIEPGADLAPRPAMALLNAIFSLYWRLCRPSGR